jgi:NAD(P)-dependent dehydrogenase (short-subunit alcohol dehydrogenase family)
MHFMSVAVFVSGASSGIGAALVETVPYIDARVVGISRRRSARSEHLNADLANPATWPLVAERFETVLNETQPEQAVFLHMAGVGTPYGTASAAPPDAYSASVLLNSASGQVLGQAFISVCARRSTPATLVLCSSPAALTPMAGMSHYGSGKVAMEYWVRAVAEEATAAPGVRAIAVVPFAVDTPMLQGVIRQSKQPVPAAILDAAADRRLASPEATALEIWRLVTEDTPSGTIVPVGAVPAGIAIQ